MVDISVDLENECLSIKIGGDNFTDLIEMMKNNKCTWNPKAKQWEKSIFDFDEIVEEFRFQGENVQVSELTKQQVAEYKANLSELEINKSRVRVNWDLMHFPPLKGIPPYENFQGEDILRALGRNRFLFNWSCGLGKSYALAALIENLRYNKFINKCLIFSTGVGVFNLKDELLKFGKNFKSEDIFVLNSITEKAWEDRDIFNTEKYPHSIIIMTYDAFKSVNNYYYDKANVSPRFIEKIEKAETEYKLLFDEKKADLKSKGMKAAEIKKILDADKDLLIHKTRIKDMKNKLHPSEKTKYRKSFIPIKEWLGGHNGGLFLDEVHSLANPGSRRSELFEMNIAYFKYRYEFTGTLADKHEKLYEPLYILDKALVEGKTYSDWLSSYCEIGNRWSRYAINDNSWDLDKIKALNELMLKSYASKRDMRDCLDLPMDYDVPTIYLDMGSEQREIYQEFVKAQLTLSKERKLSGEATAQDSIMNMFGLFQLAVDNPECIKSSASFEKLGADIQSKIESYDYAKHSNKLAALQEVVKERVNENGEKGIIWYYHPVTKEALKKVFKNYEPIIIEAGMDKEVRNKMLAEFKSNKNKKLLIASINVMNTSVTLIECKWQAYLEKTYNYTVFEQSRHRINRPGQTDLTRTYDFCYKDSIDYMQKENLTTKGQLLNSLLNKQYIENDLWKRIFNANKGDNFY